MSARRQSFSWALASCLVLTGSCGDEPGPLEPVASQALAKKKPPTNPPPPDTETPPTNNPPPDTQAPTPPAFSVTALGPTHVTLAWSSTDLSTPILYRIERNGELVQYGFESSRTFAGLQPSTAYTFTGKARDGAGNWSTYSAPFTVTTAAADANDATPPTAPAGVWAYLDGGGTEMLVYWGASSDNVTPQVAIVYHVLVNGVVDNSAVGTTQSRVYGVTGDNVISVVAVDAAGNRSAAATFNIFIPF
jgi:hypothetical protein